VKKADRFKKAANVAEQLESLEERKSRGLGRSAQLHFQDTFFVGVMTFAVNEQKTGKLSEFSADLVSQWNALSVDQRNRGYSIYERYFG